MCPKEKRNGESHLKCWSVESLGGSVSCKSSGQSAGDHSESLVHAAVLLWNVVQWVVENIICLKLF